MKKELMAIIPARGGSKTISRKNVKELNGTPLIGYTIRAAIENDNITRVVVSTDDNEIADIAIGFGVEVLMRSSVLAQDNSQMVEVILHCLDNYASKENYCPDRLILLQPTSPLRRSDHIDSAINVLEHQICDAVISVCEPSHHPLKSFKSDEHGFLIGIIDSEFSFTPRQQVPRAFMPNGAIHLIENKVFKKYKSFLPPRTLPFIMSRKESIDIDDIDDLDYASFLLSKCVTSTKS